MAHIEVKDPAAPGSPEWQALITASKIPAIAGLSRWETPYSLWHRMAGNRPDEEPKDIYAVGHAMEHALAALYKAEYAQDWTLSRGEVQFTDTDLPFPNAATIDRRATKGRKRRVVEFKTTRDWALWGDVNREPAAANVPTDYYFQVQWQMGVTGFTELPAHLLVMGPFFDHRLYEIPFDQGMYDGMKILGKGFHQSLELGVEPDYTGAPADYTVIRELHPDIDGTTVEVTDELADEYHQAVKVKKDAEANERTAKALILKAMGNAETAIRPDGTIIAKRTARGKTVTLSPKLPK